MSQWVQPSPPGVGAGEAGGESSVEEAEEGLDVIDPSLCCVCITNRKETLLLPCRHLCVCNDCGTLVVERGNARCPLCRVSIQARVLDCFWR